MVDGYGNIYAPLLPLLIPRLGLSLAAAGTLTMLYQIAASVSQVGFGRLADSWRPRLPRDDRPGGCRRRPQPHRARHDEDHAGDHPVRRRAGRRRLPSARGRARAPARRQASGLAMSVHITGGTLGFSLGPLLFAPFAERFGIEWTPLLAIPGLMVIALFLRRVPPFPQHHGQRSTFRVAAPVRQAARPALPDRRPAHADVAVVRDLRAGDDDAPRLFAGRGRRHGRAATCSRAASAGSSAGRRRIGSGRAGSLPGRSSCRHRSWSSRRS